MKKEDEKKTILVRVTEWYENHPGEWLTRDELAEQLGVKTSSLGSTLNRNRDIFVERDPPAEARGKGKPAKVYCHKDHLENAKQSKNEITCPPGLPLQGDEPFFIHKNKIRKDLTDFITRDRIPAVTLSGGMKTGKTSLLNWLAREAKKAPGNYSVLRVNFADAVFDENQIEATTILREFFRQIDSSADTDEIKKIAQQGMHKDVDAFTAYKLMEQIFKTISKQHESKVLLTVDGVDAIAIHDQSSKAMDEKLAKHNYGQMETFLHWLGGLRQRMVNESYSHLKLLTAMGDASFSSLLSRPLVTQTLRLPIGHLDREQVQLLLDKLSGQANEQLANELFGTLNGQIMLTHLAAQTIIEKEVEPAYFLQRAFLNTPEVDAYGSQLKKDLCVALLAAGYPINDFFTLCKTLLEFTENPDKGSGNHMINHLWTALEHNGVIDQLGKISAPFFEELLMREREHA